MPSRSPWRSASLQTLPWSILPMAHQLHTRTHTHQEDPRGAKWALSCCIPPPPPTRPIALTASEQVCTLLFVCATYAKVQGGRPPISIAPKEQFQQ